MGRSVVWLRACVRQGRGQMDGNAAPRTELTCQHRSVPSHSYPAPHFAAGTNERGQTRVVCPVPDFPSSEDMEKRFGRCGSEN